MTEAEVLVTVAGEGWRCQMTEYAQTVDKSCDINGDLS